MDVESLSASVFESAKTGDPAELRRLIAEAGAAEILNHGDAKRNGCTPLHYAAWNGMSVCCGILVEAGADVNCLDNYGRTPMHFAARTGHLPVIDQLATLGGDVNIRQQLGATALHYAAIEGNTAACQKLLKLGADVFATNDSGISAIGFAEKKDQIKTIEYLKHAIKKRSGSRDGRAVGGVQEGETVGKGGGATSGTGRGGEAQFPQEGQLYTY